MSFPQPPVVDPLPPSTLATRKRWGKALFFALTLSSVFVLVFAGWATLSAHNALQAVPTQPPLNILPNDVAAGLRPGDEPVEEPPGRFVVIEMVGQQPDRRGP